MPQDHQEGQSIPPRLAEDLATELYSRLRGALVGLGVDEATQDKALERSRRESPPTPSSGIQMRNAWGLAFLLTEWSRAPEYLNADGQPKILKLYGEGTTFETLAKRFLPEHSVPDVIEHAKTAAEIEMLPRNRIALAGSVLVNILGKPETLLAHAVRHLDLLLRTLVHNAAVPEQDRQESGYMERMVVGVIRKDKLAELMKAFRPQIYNLLLQFDTEVEQRAPKSYAEIDDATSVAIGMYVAEEADWQRSGVNPKAVLPKAD